MAELKIVSMVKLYHILLVRNERTRVAGTFSATVRMYYVYVYVAVILLQICYGPSAV